MPTRRWISVNELQERREEWRSLALHSAFPTTYGDPAWLLAWWQHFGQGVTPWCLALEDEGSLRGLALLALGRVNGLRTLSFMGAPWNGIDSLVYAEGAEAELTDGLLDELSRRSAEWHLWRIRRLPLQTHLAERLLKGGGPLRASAHDLRLQPYLDLPDDVATFEAGFPAKQRHRQRRRWRRLLDAGLSPQLVNDPDQVASTMHALLEMRRRRAQIAGQRQRNLDERFEHFATTAVKALLPDGARLWKLQDAEGNDVAICLTLIEGYREHGYMIAIGDEHGEHRPGHSLKHHVVLDAVASGRREFDLGPGRDESKYSLGAVDRKLVQVVVGSRSWSGRLAGTLAGIDLRARDTKVADWLRRRRGMTSERAD